MISESGVLKRAAIAQHARRRGFDIQMSHDNAASRL